MAQAYILDMIMPILIITVTVTVTAMAILIIIAQDLVSIGAGEPAGIIHMEAGATILIVVITVDTMADTTAVTLVVITTTLTTITIAADQAPTLMVTTEAIAMDVMGTPHL